jgi:H+/Cl- antiporter ClcA
VYDSKNLALTIEFFVLKQFAEGPSVEIGVNLSRSLTASMKNQIPTTNLSEVMKHNRLLLSCGGAAGVAAGFNAPIAGIFFALEVIQGTFISISNTKKKVSSNNLDNNNNVLDGRINVNGNNDADMVLNVNENLISTQGGISSIVLASVLAALISATLLGDELVFKVTEYSLKTPLLELPLYLLLGSLCGVLAFVFSQLSNGSKQFFDGKLGPEPIRDSMSSIPSVVKPVIGGIFCGLVGIVYPQILFFGYETLNNLLAKTSISTELLLTLLAMKMITTSVASGSGLVGGTFAPSLFFGGMLGASFHNVFEFLFQSTGDGIADLPAYAMIGSASVLAALFRAPLTASLLLFECTREYEIILPLMASAGLASVVADVLELWSTQEKNSKSVILGKIGEPIASDAATHADVVVASNPVTLLDHTKSLEDNK